MLKISEVLEELKKASKILKLKFNKNWFKFVWITKEQEILTEYLSDCRDPIYEKYGHKLSERIKNLGTFYDSKDYKKCIIRCGGQVISKNSFSRFRNFVKRIKNQEIKDILLDFCKRVEKNMQEANKIAALTETSIEKEKEQLVYRVLRHEWIHILLEENHIRSNNWKYNEGLVSYFEFYIDKNLNNLEKSLKLERYDFNKEYFLNAIIFRDLLKEVSDKEKIQKIKDFLKIN